MGYTKVELKLSQQLYRLEDELMELAKKFKRLATDATVDELKRKKEKE